MIQLKNVSKKYRIGSNDYYALDDVSVSVNSGEFVSIRGASGSGKTTLLNIIGCLDKSTEGTYLLDGEDVSKLSDERASRIRNKKIGFVFQDFALVESQRVLYNTMLPLLLGDLPYKIVKEKAIAALDAVGLRNHAKKKVNQLSGGERQRVAIARAIVNDPAILLADEPTGQLDSKTGVQIMQIMKELNNKGMTTIIVTHDDKIAEYATRHIYLSDGRIVE